MKKNLVLLGMFLSLAVIPLQGQINTEPVHVTPTEVAAIPTIQVQLKKIEEKEAQIQQATTSSRGQLATLKQELVLLNEEYKNTLKKEITLCANDHLRNQLERELNYLETTLAPSNQR